MCETYFKDFSRGFDELYNLYICNSRRELWVYISETDFISLNFDFDRVKEVIGFKPVKLNGHDSLPVIVNKKVKLLLAFDRSKNKWFLPCGKVHFAWCTSYRGHRS